MKKCFYAGFLLMLVSCSTKKGTPFIVEGTIKNADVPMVYLEENGNNRARPVVVDSAEIEKDGHFRLDPVVQEEGLFSLRAGSMEYPFAVLVNDSKKIGVNADLANRQDPYSVSGSSGSVDIINLRKKMVETGMALSQLRMQYINQDSLFRSSKDPVSRKYNDSVRTAIVLDYQGKGQAFRDYSLSFFDKTSHPSALLYTYDIVQQFLSDFELPALNKIETATIVNKAADRFPANTAIADWKKKAGSSQAPDFSLPDTSGQSVSLSSFKGKYVLVDFWASWCGPCRDENPNVVSAYNQFRDRNFTILGVSLDHNKPSWLKAIKDDSLTWTHVSDLKYWDSEAAALYNVRGIPYNFLLDPNGNIVAENIRGGELFKTLERTLK